MTDFITSMSAWQILLVTFSIMIYLLFGAILAGITTGIMHSSKYFIRIVLFWPIFLIIILSGLLIDVLCNIKEYW